MNEEERGTLVPNRGYPFFNNLIEERTNFMKIISEVESCYPQENHYGGISFVMRYNNDVANVRFFLNFNDLIDIHVNKTKFGNLLLKDVQKVLDQFEYRASIDTVVSFTPDNEEEWLNIILDMT